MKFRSARIATPLAALLMLLITTCATTRTQAQETQSASRSSDWDFGYELFQALLEQQGLTAVDYETMVLSDPQDSVLVIQGKVDSRIAKVIPKFCSDGGTVLVACDTLTYLGASCTFREGPVLTRDSSQAYQSFPDCIQISQFNNQHPLMAGIGSIVVNKSGWLKRPRLGATTLDVAATLPASCEPSESANQPLLATANLASLKGGKLILCADQSLFTNGMLWHADNSILAINIANALAEGKQRSQVCFVVKGRAQKSYQDSPNVNPNGNPDLPDVDLPEPKLKTMLKVANKIVKNVEESNVANEFLANQPRNVKAPYYRRAILFVLVAIVAGLVARFLFGSFSATILISGGVLLYLAVGAISASRWGYWLPGRSVIAVFLQTIALLPAVVYVLLKLFTDDEATKEAMPARSMKTAFDLRANKKISDSEFGFAASMLARELCKEVTDSADPAVWLRQLKSNPVSKKQSAAKSNLQVPLSTVVDLAVNSQTTHISRQRFANIGHTINELRQMHRDGQLLLPASSTSS